MLKYGLYRWVCRKLGARTFVKNGNQDPKYAIRWATRYDSPTGLERFGYKEEK